MTTMNELKHRALAKQKHLEAWLHEKSADTSEVLREKKEQVEAMLSEFADTIQKKFKDIDSKVDEVADDIAKTVNGWISKVEKMELN